MPKSKRSSPGPDLDDQQQASLVQMGKLMGDPRDDFDREVEGHLQRLSEASAGKMHAAQTGGGDMSLGPSAMDQAAVKQGQALNKQADTQAAAQAQQAQGAQAPVNAPAAPTGPQGTTTVFPAQKGAVGGPGNAGAPSQATPPPSTPGPGGPPPEEDEEGPPQ